MELVGTDPLRPAIDAVGALPAHAGDKDAPTLTVELVDRIDLEGHFAQDGGLQLGARVGTEGNRAAVEHVIDGECPRLTISVDEGDSTHRVYGQQRQAPFSEISSSISAPGKPPAAVVVAHSVLPD